MEVFNQSSPLQFPRQGAEPDLHLSSAARKPKGPGGSPCCLKHPSKQL